MQTEPRRIQAIKTQLDFAAEEYIEARDNFQEAQVAYESARDKLAGVKQLAGTMMSPYDWHMWADEHKNIRFVGTSLGDAILTVLSSHAYTQAWLVVSNVQLRGLYDPTMPKDSIVEQLEVGGFDFRTSTPNREVSAAMLRLEGMEEREDGTYAVISHAEILSYVREVNAESEKQS